MLESNHYSVLFTGGLDSTYRLCQLARDEKAVVQPVYIVFSDNGKSPHIRPELQKEIEAQDKILNYLVSHQNTKAKILSIKRIQRDEIPSGQKVSLVFNAPFPDWDLRYAWETQLSRGGLGWQYYYIALYSHWVPDVELCQEVFPVAFNRFNIKFYLDNFNRKKICLDDSLGKSYDFFNFLFKDFSFPIIGVTREKMLSDLKIWGFYDVLKYIWFCYQSIDGKACGVCDNCFAKINQGLTFLFPKDAIKRYYIYKTLFLINRDISLFYKINISHGEKKFLDKILTDEFKSKSISVEGLSLSFKFFIKLFNLNCDYLKKIVLHGGSPVEVYNLVVNERKRR